MGLTLLSNDCQAAKGPCGPFLYINTNYITININSKEGNPLKKSLILLIMVALVMGMFTSVIAKDKVIDNATHVQEVLNSNNPNVKNGNLTFTVKTVNAGKSGNTILVDPLDVFAD